jgi:hypothetical protein
MEAIRVSSRTLAMLLVIGASAGAQGVVPTPTIAIRIVDESGTAVEKGRAEIAALKRWAYVERGLVTIADLPTGTWTVVVRVPGFHPDSIAVAAALPSAAVPVLKLRSTGEVVLEERDTVTFIPSAKDSAVLHDIAERMRAAHGTLIRYDDPAVRNAERASDPIRLARGFRWHTVNTIRTNSGCMTLPRADTLANQRQQLIALYVDGNRTASALETVDRMVPTREILAIETYADMIAVPARWRSSNACAVVAYWTKR